MRGEHILDPEVAAVIDAMEEHAATLPAEVPLSVARADHEAQTPALAGPLEPVAEVRDLAVAAPAGSVPVRVLRPEGEEPLPVVAYFHGGGWALGSIESVEGVCRALANAAGAIVVDVGYRLAPEHPFPAALDDALAVVRWLAGPGAAEIGGDPRRIAVAGDSAGGNLATVVARKLRDEGPELRLQLLVYPACDASADASSYDTYRVGFGLSADSMRNYWSAYLAGADARDPDASPLAAGDLGGMAPAHVILAEHDVLHDDGTAYARALEAAGVPVTVSRFEGCTHGFWRWQGVCAPARRAMWDAAGALREALR